MPQPANESESRQYGEMLTEVESIAREIDGEQLELDVLVAKVERGYDLIKKMRGRLALTKEKIESLRETFENEN